MAAGIGDLTLTFHYDSKAKRGAVNETLKIPFVTDIERSVNVNLTEMPTLIYGCRNNFCMDLGATEKVTFKCERINPVPYDDAQKTNPEKWSNGKWYRHLEDLFDRWQNFGRNDKGARTGGCRVVFTPADATLLPSIDANVFLTGAISPSYDVQKMSFSLPFTLADMTMSQGTAETVTITLDPGTPSMESETVSLLKGFPQVIPVPDGWESARPGMILIGWRIGSDRISKSSSYTFSKDMTATAIWNEPTRCYWCTSDTVTVVDSDETYMTAYLIGAGGGGGGSGYARSGTFSPVYWFVGGGGGAGEVVTWETDVTPGSNIRIQCGTGGTGGTTRTGDSGYAVKPTDGGAGGNTLLRIDSSTVATAHGGSGGVAATITLNGGSNGAGGSSYQAGGTHSGSKGGDGSTASPNISANVGKGMADHYVPTDGAGTSASPPRTFAGGCGGAAAAFRMVDAPLTVAGMETEYTTVQSIGGDGGDPETGTHPQDGQFGGGGGSGRYETLERAGVGGNGAALILFYKGGLRCRTTGAPSVCTTPPTSTCSTSARSRTSRSNSRRAAPSHPS